MALITRVDRTVEYLVAEGIPVTHGFTTRLGGVSQGYLASMNLGMHRGDDPENVRENFRLLGEALGFDPEKLVLTRQIHSAAVRVVDSRDCRGLDTHDYPECDALITREPGVGLVVFSADCTPVLLHDPVTGAVGAAHAGWRGTAGDIVGNTVRAMTAHFGCDPGNIRAAIGPNIGPCCFETDAEVPDALVRTLGQSALDHIRQENSKYYPDLKAVNAQLLRRAGVRQIDISTHCTRCQHHRFWSHRYTGGLRGSQGALIICEGGSL